MSHTSSKNRFEIATSSRKIQTVIGISIILLSVFFVLAGIELIGYFWEKKTAQDSLGWTLVASRRMPLARHGSAENPYYLFETDKEYFWEGVPVNISSQGFRDDEFSVEKTVGTYRILNLGDSVVFGWEVSLEDTYGEKFEKMLNDLDDGLTYQVINAGIPGWNLPMERDFLFQEGLSYEPDMIILDITLVNDIYGKGPVDNENPGLFAWLRDHTYGWPFLTTQARFLLAQKQGPEAIPVLNPPQQENAYYPLNREHPAWERMWETILEMNEACQAHGVKLVMIVFPTAFQLNSSGHSDFPQRFIKEKAAAADIYIVDMLPIYRQVCDSAEPGACEGYENILFADVWMHPNVLGHQLAAEALFDMYQE